MDQLKNQNLTGARLRVLMYLAWRHDHRSGQSWPSMQSIAIETGLEERSVRRAIAFLEKNAFIRIAHRGNGRGHLTRYEFPALIQQLGLELTAPAKGDMLRRKEDQPLPERRTASVQKEDQPVRPYKEEKQIEKQKQKGEGISTSKIDSLPVDPWTLIKTAIRESVSIHSYETWLTPTRFDHVRDGVLFVQIPAPDFSYIGQKFGPQIAQALAALGMQFKEVQFITTTTPRAFGARA